MMNQGLEILIHAYIGPVEWDDWSDLLDALALSYNTSPHTATGFTPAYLLQGYHPITGSMLLGGLKVIERDNIHEYHSQHEALDKKALHMTEGFEAEPMRENIQAWYNDFQSMGWQAVQWTCTVRDQSVHYGVDTCCTGMNVKV